MTRKKRLRGVSTSLSGPLGATLCGRGETDLLAGGLFDSRQEPQKRVVLSPDDCGRKDESVVGRHGGRREDAARRFVVVEDPEMPRAHVISPTACLLEFAPGRAEIQRRAETAKEHTPHAFRIGRRNRDLASTGNRFRFATGRQERRKVRAPFDGSGNGAIEKQFLALHVWLRRVVVTGPSSHRGAKVKSRARGWLSRKAIRFCRAFSLNGLNRLSRTPAA